MVNQVCNMICPNVTLTDYPYSTASGSRSVSRLSGEPRLPLLTSS
jgi:hypothetical protein